MRPGETYDDWFRRVSPGAARTLDSQNKIMDTPPVNRPSAAGRSGLAIKEVPVTPAMIKATRKASNTYKAKEAVGKVGAVGEALIPYASNIVNAFRKAPRATYAGDVSSIAGRRFTMDAARSGMREAFRTKTGAADRMLDENTAAAVKGSSYAGYLQGIGRVGEAEMNQNYQSDMDVNQTNSRISMFNKQSQQQNLDDNANRRMINQSNQSANLANAADKFITAKNYKTDAQNQLDAVRMYNLNDIAGVKARLATLAQKEGIGTEEDWGVLKGKKKYGGPISRRGMRSRISG